MSLEWRKACHTRRAPARVFDEEGEIKGAESLRERNDEGKKEEKRRPGKKNT